MAFRGTRAGRYRQVIDVHKPRVLSRDTVGDELTEPEMIYPAMRCDVNPGRGREFEVARERNADVTHLITARYRPGMNLQALTSMRITLQRRELRILYAINKDETNREIYIAATEVIKA